MSTDVESVDVLNLSVIYENDEDTVDDGRVYHFYKYGENIDDVAMKVKLQLAEYRLILDSLYQHSAENRSMRSRLSKITKRKTSIQLKNKCHVCNIPINLDKSSDFVSCGSCNQSPICRNLHCAIWSDKAKVWNCKLCRSFLNGSSSACDWLIAQLNEKLVQGKSIDNPRKIVWNESNTDENAPLIPLEQREKVREFVEELVSTLVGGSIDNAPVGQLYEQKECLPIGENETDSIDQSHAKLKHLVQRIIEEVFKIPEFFDHSGVPKEPQRINLPEFDPKKYEELLATAVLNQLVESYSYERRFENSSGIHSGSDIDGNVQTTLEKAQLETISTSSSNEPRSDSSNSVSLNDQPMSLTATDFILHLSTENSISSPIDSPPQTPRSVGSDEEAYLSDYIQKHQVPLPGIDSDSFDEDFQSVNSNDTEGNWQENWLFKKRKLKNEMKNEIGMLVPSPMEDVKALIGDKTTDEVSDLSEAGSDLEDDENGPVNGRQSADLPHALIESKTIIGGKNDFGSFNDVKTIDELLQPDSLVSTQSIDNQNPVIMEAKNDLILISDSKPVVLHMTEKTIQSSSNNNNGSRQASFDLMFNDDVCVQNGSSQSASSQSAEPVTKDTPATRGSIFDTENGEPPVPTPRKKLKSLESAKAVVSVEVPTPPTIQETNSPSDNDAIVSQIIDAFDMEIDKLLAKKIQSQSSDDELLDIDSSINDIYDSLEGDPVEGEYQSLVAEEENAIIVPTSPKLILNASNQLIEDCLTETTQELSPAQLERNRFDSLISIEPTSGPSSHVSNENYICKVLPTEFDLSVDSVLQSKPDILDVIVSHEVENRSVPEAVYISSKPALIAVEIASHGISTDEKPSDNSVHIGQTTSIPTLVISNIAGDTPSPIPTTSADHVSLKPKKVLKAQDSLELPPDDREKFEPIKRVDSFDRGMEAKPKPVENVVDSTVESSPNRTEETSNVTVDLGKDSEDDFVIVTEEEAKALIIEHQAFVAESLVQVTGTESENSLISELKTTSDDKSETNINSGENDRIDQDIQVTSTEFRKKRLTSSQSFEIDETVDTGNSGKHISTLEISSQPSESNKSTVMSSRKTFELSTIPESIAPTDKRTTKPSSLYISTSNLFTSNQTINLEPATNISQQLNERGPIPGSIAEREHLKWKNAQDIPNNPYSPEALQRRLSETRNASKVIDINLALASKPVDDLAVQVESDGRPIQIVLGAGEPDQSRYGRDYYINDSKSASGTRKKASSIQRYSSTDEDNISSKATTPDTDVYTARIVQIRDDPDHTIDDSAKLRLSISDRVSDHSSLSLQSDSLTLSDDSETRVYDLRKNETAYLRSDIIRTSRLPVGATATPPPTPVDGDSLNKNLDQFFAIKQLNQLKQSEEEQETTSQIKAQALHSSGRKPLSPDTLKFFTPKLKPAFTSKFKMEEIPSIKPLIAEREENGFQQNGAIEKGVIEEDVISSLPSVKALAKNFVEPSADATKAPIQRPKIRYVKSFVWQVSNENGNNNNHNNNTTTNGHSKEPSPDSYVPMYESSYHPVAPGHSITARSLSTKFREELRHSIPDDASISTDNIEIVEREHAPDRPPSPVLLKGIFKEKMSFFQNLDQTKK